MKSKTFAYSLIVFLLFAGMFISKREPIKNIENSGSNFTVHLRSSANSGKIYVNNNWTATKAAGICTGAGTESNPYTFKNLIIDAGGIGDVIHIENTTEYFKIQNCTLFNSGGEFHNAGIRLVNATNGILINNTTYDNTHGMSIFYCLNLEIVMNRFFNVRGLHLISTNDSVIYLNTFINSYYDLADQWSTVKLNSQEKFTYTYNGRTFTNYLGNYWSSYSDPDNDGDGIGDEPVVRNPYVIGNPILRDNYPLMEPINAYSNITKSVIPGFNVISLLGIISIITILLTITIRKSFNKSK